MESYSQLNNFRQDIVRFDQNVGDRVRIFARFMQDSVPENFPFGLWGTPNYPGADPIALNAPGRNVVANVTANISSRVVNEVEYADSWGAINAALSGFANSPSFTSQLTGMTAYQDLYGRAPNVSFSILFIPAWATGTGLITRGTLITTYTTISLFNMGTAHPPGRYRDVDDKNGEWGRRPGHLCLRLRNGNDEFANFLLGQAASYNQADKDTIPITTTRTSRLMYRTTGK